MTVRSNTPPTGLAALLVLGPIACKSPPQAGWGVLTMGSAETGSGAESDSAEGTASSVPTTTEDAGGPQESGSYLLRVDDTPPPPIEAELDKAKMLEVFGEKAAKEIHLLDLDVRPMLDEILLRIRDACGDKWDDYVKVPDNQLPAPYDPDCNVTGLGQSFGATEAERFLSPEYQIVRLLTTTPRNVRLRGTIWDTSAALYESNNNSFGRLSLQDVVAAMLFCPSEQGESADACTQIMRQPLDPNDADMVAPMEAKESDIHVRPIVGIDVLAATLIDTLFASHPSVSISEGTGFLGISLYDALKDMQPFSVKYGPDDESGHPGILKPDDGDFMTHSDALNSDFRTVLLAESNLRRVEGIDASLGAGEMFVNTVTDTDPLDGIHPPPLAFDFEDPENVRFEGLTAEPTMDLRIQLMEIDGQAEPGTLAPVPSCDGEHGVDIGACKLNLPKTPIGDQYVWSQKQWTLEFIMAHAAHSAFAGREYSYCYIASPNDCLSSVDIGKFPDQPGWISFADQLNDDVVKLPPQQYLWEMFLDVSQESMHDFNAADPMIKMADGIPEIEEGDLNPVFTLRGLPLGMTSAELEKAIRPNLQEQADTIAGFLLGNYWKNNARLDFYYRRGNEIDAGGGAPLLFFVAPSDLRPSADDPETLSAYGYANPGFFADAGLTQKVSNTNLVGSSDTEHEKFKLSVGETKLYIQDDKSETYRLTFSVPAVDDPTEILVSVEVL